MNKKYLLELIKNKMINKKFYSYWGLGIGDWGLGVWGLGR